MKTFFWTSIMWILALGAFWCFGEFFPQGVNPWYQVIPSNVKEIIRAEVSNQVVIPVEIDENADLGSGETLTGTVALTGELFSGDIEVITGDLEISDEISEPAFIVTVEDDTDTEQTQTGIVANTASEKKNAALEARVEALEYHLLMLMQSLKQPSAQPTGVGMKYPVWNFNLQN